MTDVLSVVLQSALLVAAGLCAARIVRQGELADRVIGFDSLLIMLVALIALDAAVNQRTELLDVLLVVSLLGFLGTITAAAYLERRAAEQREDAMRNEAVPTPEGST